MCSCLYCTTRVFCFFFNDTATTEIYTLSLHDALPILFGNEFLVPLRKRLRRQPVMRHAAQDRKSTRLNSSHLVISYAVFCLYNKQQGPIGRCRHSRPLTNPETRPPALPP